MSRRELERWNLYGAEHSDAAIVIHAPDTSIVWTNAEAARLLGISRDELTGKLAADPSFRLFDEHLVDLPLERYPVVLALQSRQRVDDYIVGLTHAGATKPTWGKLSAQPVFEDGELSAVVVTFVDVTALQEARQALAASEERLAYALAGTSEGLWDVDVDTKAAWFGPRFAELLGVDPGDIPPNVDGWAALVHPDDLAGVDQAVTAHVERGEPYDTRYRMRHATHGWRWFRARAKASRTPDGRVRMAGSIGDITSEVEAEQERRKAQARLEESARLEALGLLAGGIAHDFNNLLVGVLSAADTARHRLHAPAELDELLGTITDSAVRARDLTRQLMAYAGRGAIVLEVLDPGNVVGELIRLTRGSLIKAELTFTRGDAPPVEADGTQLRQVVLNLLTNANDAVGDGGRIEVTTGARRMSAGDLGKLGSTGQPGDYATIAVSDTGRGMDDAMRRRIFEPFFTTKTEGHGLGLAAVRGMVRAHGGFIRVESAPGKGARFELGLPATTQQPAPSAATNEDVQRLGEGRHALVVDDEKMVRRVLRRMLELHGFSVDELESGRGLDESLAARVPDVLVLDLTMPGTPGAGLLEMVRQSHPRLPVLLASGHTNLDQRVTVPPGAPIGFLAKPFSMADLESRLAELLR